MKRLWKKGRAWMPALLAFFAAVMLVPFFAAAAEDAAETEAAEEEYVLQAGTEEKEESVLPDASEVEDADPEEEANPEEDASEEENADPEEDPAETDPASPAGEGEFPELNEDGFLDSGEFVYENDEEGLWRYASSTLWVEVRRIIQAKPARTWYEAEIRCAEESETPHMIPLDPEKWMTKTAFPYKLARKNRTVIAISADYAWQRYVKKARTGILLRNGEIISTRTRKAMADGFPNLDTLAIFPDGDMQVFYSDEKTAKEYQEMGALDVLSFGPWLIRDGERNEKGLKKYGTTGGAERVAVGMAEKGHYWFMMLEGRIKRSRGDNVSFLANKLEEKGCTVAFNLDGGQTACILFMGHQLCKMDDKPHNKSSRTTAEILGVGTSELVRTLEDPW